MKNKVLLLKHHQMGHSDADLGENLLETFFTLLNNQKDVPIAVFCMHKGVFTMTDHSFVSVQLKALSERGVYILACRTCAEYYQIDNALTVGNLSSMAHFIELASQYEVMTIA